MWLNVVLTSCCNCCSVWRMDSFKSWIDLSSFLISFRSISPSFWICAFSLLAKPSIASSSALEFPTFLKNMLSWQTFEVNTQTIKKTKTKMKVNNVILCQLLFIQQNWRWKYHLLFGLRFNVLFARWSIDFRFSMVMLLLRTRLSLASHFKRTMNPCKSPPHTDEYTLASLNTTIKAQSFHYMNLPLQNSNTVCFNRHSAHFQYNGRTLIRMWAYALDHTIRTFVGFVPIFDKWRACCPPESSTGKVLASNIPRLGRCVVSLRE